MASVASPPRHEPRLLATPASTWISWPARYWKRIALYLAFALPLIALALWAEHRGYAHPELTLLEHRAGLVRAGGSGLAGIRYLYPPIPTLLALALPNDAVALSIVTCLCSAVIIGYVCRRLLRRTSLVTMVALLLPMMAVPIMWYAASQLLLPVTSLAFLAVALEGFIRFTVQGETEGGFVAGLALAGSILCDPGAFFYGLVMCAFVPLVGIRRYRNTEGTVALSAVLCFPFAVITLGWIFLVWKFSGSWLAGSQYAPGAHPFDFTSGVGGGLLQALRTAGADLLHVPLYFAAVMVLGFRRRLAALGLLLPLAALALALWLGFVYSAIAVYLLLSILALVTISDSAQRRLEPMLVVVALGQFALALAWPPTTVFFTQWVHAVT
jgi:hypothetical protein